jgi:hypothetical protein
MVTRLSQARLGNLILSNAARKAFAPVPKLVRALDPEEVAIRRDDLDQAIAHLSRALSALLELEVRGSRDADNPPPPRRDAMATESAASNVNERYDVFVVENYEDGAGAEKSNWTRIGVAFPHKDSDGLNVELRAVPVSGKLVIRRHVAKPRAASDAESCPPDASSTRS